MTKKVVFCIPTLTRPFQACLDSLGESVPLVTAAGWEENSAWSIGCPYISRARETMLSKALAANADVIVFIDHDLSWEPEDLLKLLETEGDVVAGTYRFKKAEEEYMGAVLSDIHERPKVRESDGAIAGFCVPAGFLKVTRRAIHRFMLAFPELMYVDDTGLTVDLFNHGAHKGVWYGEDYAFSRRWLEIGGEIWIVPDLNLTHHQAELGEDGKVNVVPYPGNFHRFLLRQPGGSESDNPIPPEDLKRELLGRLKAA